MTPLFDLWFQDGSEIPVAVKTCKEDNEESMTEKFLEEACKTAVTLQTCTMWTQPRISIVDLKLEQLLKITLSHVYLM